MSEELEQLRRQYEELKQEVEKRKTVDEQHILASINKDLHAVNGKVWMSLASCMIAIPLLVVMSLSLDLRPAFLIISITWVLLMHIGNYLRNRKLTLDSMSSESVQSFLEEMKKRKKNQFRWVRINYSIFIIWLGYFIGELFHTGMDKEALYPVILGLATGAVIGILIGMRTHNRIIGTFEGIILELENPSN